MQIEEGLCLLEMSPEESKRRNISFALGCFVELLGLAVMVLVVPRGWLYNYSQGRPAHEYELTMYPFAAGQAPTSMPLSRRRNPLAKSRTHAVVHARRVRPPQVERPADKAPLPVPEVSEQPPVAVAAAQPAPPIPLPPPAVHVNLPEPAPAQRIHTGVFGDLLGVPGEAKAGGAVKLGAFDSAAGSGPGGCRGAGGMGDKGGANAAGDPGNCNRANLRHVQTGGFGSPQGMPGNARGGSLGNVAKLGAFDLPVGPGRGNGTGGSQGAARIVAVGVLDVPAGPGRASGPGSQHVKTGGFGGVEGLPEGGRPGNSANGPTLGAFGSPTGSGGETGAGARGSPRVVASAGFGGVGDGKEGGQDPGRGAPAAIKTGVFAAAPAAPPGAKPPTAAVPRFRPVEILTKPTPQYTEEARRLGVQGEVVLSVVFQADGVLKVVSVVKSLGHGLDQMAIDAAMQIRFRPAEEAGQQTDFAATLRIEFQLT